MTYTAEQIELCRQLYEKLGVKREPKVGEWWVCEDGKTPCFITCEETEENRDMFCMFYRELVSPPRYMTTTMSKYHVNIHPLYSVEELLEIILNESVMPIAIQKVTASDDIIVYGGFITICTKNNPHHIDDNNLKTALLKLAVEVTAK